MPEEQRFRYDAVYEKTGMMVFISHLDLMRLFRRGIRRAGLPFVLTGGFTPRVKISMPMALKLGRESMDEKMTIWLKEEVDPALLREAVNSQMPEGVRLKKVTIFDQRKEIENGKKARQKEE